MIEFAIMETVWGPSGFVAQNERLLATYTPSSEPRTRRRIADDWPDAIERSNILPRFRRALVSFYRGTPVEFDVEIDVRRFSEFQQAVLHACRRIPYGKTASYADLARAAGRPGAARAAGSTMARNPMPIVIPCHRVVRADGGIGGFSSARGVGEKQQLLDMEREAIDAPARKRGRAKMLATQAVA